MAGCEDPCLGRAGVLTGEKGCSQDGVCERPMEEFGSEKPVETVNQESGTIIKSSCGSSWRQDKSGQKQKK